MVTFFMLGETEKDVPTRYENHVILKVLLLDFGLLHNHYICLKSVEHGLIYIVTIGSLQLHLSINSVELTSYVFFSRHG